MSDFERDMRVASELGAKAVRYEIDQPGIRAGSDKVRYEFRKGILSRYVPQASAEEWQREAINDQRMSLHYAYYGQPQMISAINAKPESFDIVETIDAQPFEVAELVTA